MKTDCSRCGLDKTGSHNTYCTDCYNRYKRVRRLLVPDVKFKEGVRSAASYAQKRGILVAPDECPKCKSTDKIAKHHPDYEKPLDVQFMCARCHVTEHNLEKTRFNNLIAYHVRNLRAINKERANG